MRVVDGRSVREAPAAVLTSIDSPSRLARVDGDAGSDLDSASVAEAPTDAGGTAIATAG
jgi:hypothetical protein